MRPSLFKITAILALFVSVVTAQTKTVYQKSFPTKSNTKLNLDLTNASVYIETSSNNEIQIDFSLEFKNYSTEEIQKIVDGIQVDSRTRGNIIDFRTTSKTKIARVSYALNSNEGFVLDSDDWWGKGGGPKNPHKTQDQVLNEIRKNNGLGDFFKKMKILGEDGKKRPIDLKTVQTIISKFVIKVPKDVSFQLRGTETQVFVLDELTQKVDIGITKGLFQAKKITNKDSRLSGRDTNVYVESIAVNKLALDDVSKGIFGSIDHTDCMFKGSRVELGYIGPEVSIRDYNSKIYFYNFDQNFAALPFTGEYTELFVYDYEKNVKMKAKGSITLMFDDEDPFASSSKGVKPTTAVVETMVEKKPYGKIEVNLENGVLHVMDNKDKKQ
jgi:hypothetical protein